MKKIKILSILLFFLLSMNLSAFEKEFKDFRGLYFGNDIKEHFFMIKISCPRPLALPYEKKEYYCRYIRLKDKLEILGAKLNYIEYIAHPGGGPFFLDKTNRLAMVNCVFMGKSNFDIIKKMLIRKHGKGYDKSSSGITLFEWDGKNVVIYLFYARKIQGVKHLGILTYGYKPLMKSLKERIEKERPKTETK